MFERLAHLWQRPARGALADFRRTPRPDLTRDYRETPYLVLDLETTGLDPARDEIISVGAVAVDQWRVQLASARYWLVRPGGDVGASAVFHGLVDGHLAAASPLADVLPGVLGALAGRVLVVHGASIDGAFLQAACVRLYGGRLPLRVVDTMRLGARLYRLEHAHENAGAAIPADGLRLHTLRARYGLPPYPAHHALGDAVATAELFLAQASHLAGRRPLAARRLVGG